MPRQYLHSDLARLRAQAALTLGVSRNPEVLSDLGAMLSDDSPMVQVAAAGGILQIHGH